MRIELVAIVAALTISTSHATYAGGGSLYDPLRFQPLVGDSKARGPGDILTILVVESASATASANTTAEKHGNFGIAVNSTNSNKSASIDLSDDFAGRGQIQRSGKLAAQIAVTVLNVESNGDLWVRGQQVIEVNSEKQEIRLEGRVRQLDIAADNTVSSTRLADARIGYVGKGILGEKQSPGILTRIMSWLGLL